MTVTTIYNEKGKAYSFREVFVRPSRRIAKIENHDEFEKKTKIVSIIVFFIFVTIPFWIIPLIGIFTNNLQIIKALLGG